MNSLSSQPCPSPKESQTQAEDLAQSHLRQPCDSSVTATRLLGGPVCSTVSQKENILGSAPTGAWRREGGGCPNTQISGRGVYNPEHPTQSEHQFQNISV